MSKFQSKCLEIKKNGQEHYGRFLFQPLQPNYALTLGNALRRTLLGNIIGSAIVGVRIAGITHEFSTIPGLREDALELLLNIKEIVLVNKSKHTQFGRLSLIGPKIITASDIVFSKEVQIINTGHYLGTLGQGSNLEIEFKVENGIGYKLAKPVTSRKEADFLDIDAIFMPVNRVNYGIEKVYKNEIEFAERLIIEIWTNGSIGPDQALIFASKILSTSFFQIFKGTNLKNGLSTINNLNSLDSLHSFKNIIEKKSFDLRKVNIKDLNLSNRAYKGLKQVNINTVAELVELLVKNPRQLKQIRNFGKKSFQEVVDLLAQQYQIRVDTKL